MDLDQYIGPAPPKRGEKAGGPRVHQSGGTNEQPKRTELSRDAARLLAQLPSSLRVLTLPASFPHIVNRPAQAWEKPGEFERCMEELLLKFPRQPRRVFPGNHRRANSAPGAPLEQAGAEEERPLVDSTRSLLNHSFFTLREQHRAASLDLPDGVVALPMQLRLGRGPYKGNGLIEVHCPPTIRSARRAGAR